MIPLVLCVGYALFSWAFATQMREFWGVKGSMRIQDGDQSEGSYGCRRSPAHQCLAIGVFVVVMAAILTVVAEAVIMPKFKRPEPADRSAQLAMQSSLRRWKRYSVYRTRCWSRWACHCRKAVRQD